MTPPNLPTAIDPADEYDQIASEFMGAFFKFATENFGDRCDEFDAHCSCCRMWKCYDDVKSIAVFTELKHEQKAKAGS